MSKKDDFDDLDFSGVEGSEDFDDIDFSGVEKPEEMSQLEAAARGGAQGLTFDFADEIIGAGQAGVGALQGEEGSLKELYQKYRDSQRDQMEQAAEEHPVTYYGSDIAAGVVPALLTGGASAVGSGVAALGKTAAKGALKQAAKKAAKLGAKQGAVVGLGASEADLTEGDVAGAAIDTGVGTVLGAGLGGAMPYAGKGIKKAGKGIKKTGQVLEENIPGISSVKMGYEAGKRGITATADGVTDAALDWAEKVHGKLIKIMNKSGIDKDKAIKMADEAGERINAGELIDDVLDNMADQGALGMELSNKSKFYDKLAALKKGSKELKNLKKLEKKAAMDAAKEKAKYGAEVVNTAEGADKIDDLLPLPESKGKVDRLKSKYVADTPEGKVEYSKSFFEADPEHAIKQIELDLNDMSPSEATRALDYINDNLVGDLSKPANKQQSLARKLAGDLNNKIKESVDKISDPNKTMHNIFGGARKMGVDKIYGGQEAVEDIQDTIAKKIRSSGPSADIDKRRAFGRLKKASPELEEVVEEGEFISKLSDKVGGSDESGSVSTKGLFGSIEAVATKTSNIAGKISKSVQDKFTPATKKVSKVANKISEVSSENMEKAAAGMSSSKNKAVQGMGNQLTHALQQEDTVKNAMLWSLGQQPAFRKLVKDYIVEKDDRMQEDIGFSGIEGIEELSEPTEARVPFERPDEDTEERVPFERPEEVSRKPASVEDSTVDSVLSELDVKEGKGDLTGAAVTGNLGVTDSARKAVGTADEWANAQTEEERDLIDEKTSKQYLEKLHNDMPESWKRAPKGVQEAMLDASYNIGPSMFKWSGVNAGMESGNWQEAATQLLDSANIEGRSSKGLARRRAEAYNKIAEEVGFAPIQKIEQEEDGTIIYYNSTGEDVFSYDPKKEEIHESSKPGIIELEGVEKALDREEKQLGTGAALLGDQRSSLDDLMGQLDALNISIADKAEMQDAAYNNDTGSLRELLEKYKESMS